MCVRYGDALGDGIEAHAEVANRIAPAPEPRIQPHGGVYDTLGQALSNIAGNAVEHAAPGMAVLLQTRIEGGEAVAEITNQGTLVARSSDGTTTFTMRLPKA